MENRGNDITQARNCNVIKRLQNTITARDKLKLIQLLLMAIKASVSKNSNHILIREWHLLKFMQEFFL